MARESTRRLRSVALRILFPPLALVAGICSRRLAVRIGRVVGRLSWRKGGRDVDRATRHLDLALPERTPTERSEIGRASFESQGANLFECLRLLSRGANEVRALATLDGWEHVEAARARNQPILILTGHCGNWELLAARLNAEGLGMAAIAAEIDEPVLHEALLRLRRRFGTESIVRSQPGSARTMLKTLRDGGALGILIDQDTKVDGVWVPFFGRLAYTPVGAAEIALRRNATVLPTFIERLDDDRHHATIRPPLELPEDSTAATAAMTREIEAQINRRPEQWVWMHRRWRTRPPSEADESNEASSAAPN